MRLCGHSLRRRQDRVRLDGWARGTTEHLCENQTPIGDLRHLEQLFAEPDHGPGAARWQNEHDGGAIVPLPLAKRQ
jgi:hypothetical protein